MTSFADDLTELFSGSDVPEEHQEALRRDFVELGPEETLIQAERAEKMLRGLLETFDEVNPVMYIGLSRAQSLIMQAQERAEGYAAAYNHR